MTWQIQIQQTFGRIGLNYSPSQLDIKTRGADVNIRTQPADVEIHSIPGELMIDQSAAFAQEGRRSPLDFATHQAQQAEQVASTGVARMAELGQQIAHAHKSRQAFDMWNMQHAFQVPQLTPTLTPAPFSVHIHYQPGTVDVHTQLGQVQQSVQIHSPEITYQPSAIKAYMEQRPNLSIIPPSDHNYVV